MFMSMTFGFLPRYEDFCQAWSQVIPGDDLFSFGNDPRMGTDELTQDELWDELNKATEEYLDGDDEAGDWASAVLSCLKIEWV